jgi:hypothetical protein
MSVALRRVCQTVHVENSFETFSNTEAKETAVGMVHKVEVLLQLLMAPLPLLAPSHSLREELYLGILDRLGNCHNNNREL